MLAMLFDSSGPTVIQDISPSNANQDTSVYFPEVGYQYYQAVITIAAYPDPLSGDSANLNYTYWADGTGIREGVAGPRVDLWSAGDRVFLGLPADAELSLRVYDVGGRMIQELHEGLLPAGRHEFALKPRARGISLVVLRHAGKTFTLKVVH